MAGEVLKPSTIYNLNNTQKNIKAGKEGTVLESSHAKLANTAFLKQFSKDFRKSNMDVNEFLRHGYQVKGMKKNLPRTTVLGLVK